MNKYILTLAVLLMSSLAFSAKPEVCEGDNTLPMFGYNPKHKENSCDAKFIKEITAGGKTRPIASLEITKLGWASMMRDKDQKTAIMRLNQAWLLDHNNGKAIWGFGVWEAINKNFEKAEGFLQEAMLTEKTEAGIYIDMGRVTATLGLMKKDNKRIEKAFAFFDQAKTIKKDFVPAYAQAAALYMRQGKYEQAWNEITIIEAMKPKSIDIRLITDLEKKMPRPKK